jgi:leader peptidase (prepilin peptidase) / N-methyltransferase
MPIELLTELPNWFLWTSVSILGLLVGSFLNVVILRKPKGLEFDWLTQAVQYLQERYGEKFVIDPAIQSDLDKPAASIAMDRSHCPQCGYQLRAWHNVPVLSFLALGGKCAGCKKPISIQYPLVELLTAVLSAACFWRFGPTYTCLAALVFTWLLIAMSGIDFKTMLLPDDLTLSLLWLGLLLSCWSMFVTPIQAITGAAAGYLSLWSVYWLFKKFTGKEGMGFGDFKLLAALGAWTGIQSILMIVILSAAAGALIGMALIAIRRHQSQLPMPFGPFLAIAGWIALIFGGQLMASYWQVMGPR